MPEMFYGPWRLTFQKSDAARRNRLVVVGSDTADGTYERVYGGGPVELDVTGEAWSVEVESSPRGADTWEASIRERNTEYDPNDGIVITLHGYVGDREDVIQPNVVRCVYRDPERNPPQVPDPFDFTYARG